MRRLLLVLLLAVGLPAWGQEVSDLSRALSAAAGDAGDWPALRDGTPLQSVLMRGELRVGTTRGAVEVHADKIAAHYGMPLKVTWVQANPGTLVDGLKHDRYDVAVGEGGLFTLPGGYVDSELSSVLGAAMAEFVASGRYPDLYARYLGVRRDAPSNATPAAWVSPTPGSTLDQVLKRGVLRLGFRRQSPYYFTRDGADAGFEYELGNALGEILGKHYPGLRIEWVERSVDLPGGGKDTLFLYDGLAPGLFADEYDAILSGLIQLPDRPVATGPATMEFFFNAVYTGKDHLDVSAIRDRAGLVDFMVAHPGMTILSTPGGPSEETARALVADVAARGGRATNRTGKVEELIASVNGLRDHFLVGDAIALSALTVEAGFQGKNLNISLATGPPIYLAPITRQDP